MKVRGDVQPVDKFTVEALPQRPGWCLARFFENAVRDDSGWEYDEYHLELPDTGSLAADIEGNFGVYIQQAKAQDAAIPQEQMEGAVKELRRQSQSVSAVSSIAFVLMAEAGQIDDVTAAEHADVFGAWAYPVAYKAGNIRRYEDRLYRCLQDHTSQADWTPAAAVSLWTGISDPAEEWPEWSQPIGAHDAYQTGDKVTHKGRRYVSNTANNVWEPGIYGWDEVE